MDIISRRLAVLAATASLSILAGCVTASEGASVAGGGTENGRSCDSLTEARRNVAVQIDEAEHGSSAPNSAAGLIVLVGVLAGTPPGGPSTLWGDLASKDKQRALESMRSKRDALDHEIDEKQCTLGAKAKAGAIKETDSAQYDGIYDGKGNTDSWCAQPLLSLTVKSGRIEGELREDVKATQPYTVEGQLYEGGGVELHFERPSSTTFTDDADGQVKDNVLSFATKLDLSPKACTYRFAVNRK